MDQWITDRLPTWADADCDGEVRWKSNLDISGCSLIHYSNVKPGDAWKHTISYNEAWSLLSTKPPNNSAGEDHAELSDVNQAPKARYPIQIVAAQLQNGDTTLFVLANDHTVWELDYTVDGNYRPLPQLPQPDDNNG